MFLYDDQQANGANIPMNQATRNTEESPQKRQKRAHRIEKQQQQQSKVSHKELDDLQKILENNPQNNQQQFEPGQNRAHKNSDLPVLEQLQGQVVGQEQLFKNNGQGLKIGEEEIEQNKKQQIKDIPVQQFSDDEDEEDQQQQQQQQQQPIDVVPEKFSSSEDEDEEENEENEDLKYANQQPEESKNDLEGIQNNLGQQEKKTNKQFKIFPKELLKIGNDSVMREFLTTPLVKGYQLQMYVKRERSGLNWFSPKYHLMMSDGGALLMSAKKMSGNKSPNFIILQQNMDGKEKSDNFKKDNIRFLGKLRGNFMGKQYTLYDTGLNPNKAKDETYHRKELGFLVYENRLLDGNVPTQMKCFLPQVDKVTHVQNKEFTDKDSLSQKYKTNNFDDVKFFYTKPPNYSQEHKTYYLDFGPRIEKQSVKNYQLIDEIDDEIVYLMSGRTAKEDLFVLDIAFPFSPLQAFAVCLAGLTYKP